MMGAEHIQLRKYSEKSSEEDAKLFGRTFETVGVPLLMRNRTVAF